MLERSVDIIAALMMQNGTVMADDFWVTPTFDRIPAGSTRVAGISRA